MGITCEEHAFAYGDNKLVLDNNKVTTFTLKKNMNSQSYQFARESCARDE